VRSEVEEVSSDRAEALVAYERAWTLPEESEIRAQLERCWTARSTHLNPLTDTVRGIDALTKLILDFPAMFPGAAFRLTSVPDIHHDVARFAWRLRSTARIRMLGRDFGFSVEGCDYVEFDEDNRIRRVIAFFGPLARPHGTEAEAEAEHGSPSALRPGGRARAGNSPESPGPAQQTTPTCRHTPGRANLWGPGDGAGVVAPRPSTNQRGGRARRRVKAGRA
jgi:hypothetical protein